ncbi:MAG: HAD-IIB family hydrolase [Opitutales bacterium]
MEYFNPQAGIRPAVLATDLDGTFIPLAGSLQNREDLRQLAGHFESPEISLIFATGRHYESVLEVMGEIPLPEPDWLICDVGSRILHHTEGSWQELAIYTEHLQALTGGLARCQVEAVLEGVEGLKLQVPEHQTELKISYQCASARLEGLLTEVGQRLGDMPYTHMGSVDPFLDCGLIDVMPAGVSKAYALLWLATHADFRPDEMIYAGDSGNDLAALAGGFRGIVVANASKGLSDKVAALQKERGIPDDHLYQAQGTATSGVLEGCRHYGLL